MNERVTMLRQRSLETEANISAERAELITDFYRSAGHTSVPVQRALAFKYLLYICIDHPPVYLTFNHICLYFRIFSCYKCAIYSTTFYT